MSHVIFGYWPGALTYRLITENRFWEDHLLAAADTLRDLPPNARVLDIGCGPGRGTLKLARRLRPDIEVVGLDVSLPMIEMARHARAGFPDVDDRVRFVSGDARDLPFEDDAFDAVLGHSVLYLIDDPVRVLHEASRVARPGGRVLFMEPASEGGLVQAAFRSRPSWGDALRTPFATLVFLFAMVHWRMLARLTASCVDTQRARRWTAHARLPSVELTPTMGSLGWRLQWRVPAESQEAGVQEERPLLAAVAGQR